MAFHDVRLELARNLAVTTPTLSHAVDLGASPPLRSLAMQDLSLVVCVGDQGLANQIADTLTISLYTDFVDTFTLLPVVLWSTTIPLIFGAGYGPGYQLAVVPPPTAAVYNRFIALYFSSAPNPLSQGTFNAHFVSTPTIRYTYPDAV